jgi:endonuclease/exonuclease/phosphatase family metal-dependent hydrolase
MMKVLQYNVLDGCQGERERFNKLSRWIGQCDYDVIGFNELNGWNKPPTLADNAKVWDYSYSELFHLKNSKHFIGAVSKYPIEIIDKQNSPFHHGLLHAVINGIHFFITHLTPFSAKSREAETEAIIEKTKEFMDKPIVIMGDLNTLSPLDESTYAKEKTVNILRSNESLKKKFLSDEFINYQPMQILLDGGFIDIGATNGFQYSVPTAINRDKMHAAHLRLDYILANEHFLKNKPKVRTLHEEDVDYLSDHYPIECTW